MTVILYNFFIFLYTSAIKIAALWNHKAKLWVEGRKNFPSIPGNSKSIWVHCASLGEFEQGRPIIEKMKEQYPDFQIVLSFFSPSGYEIRKKYSKADHIIYLPADTPENAKKLIEIINPELVIWVKYEYWHYYLHMLKSKGIPVILVSAIFRKNQPFFSSYGKFWRNMLGCFSRIFVQDEASAKLLQSINIENVTVSGDTRFDRVSEIAKSNQDRNAVEDFIGKFPVLVAGSTWPEDEDNIAAYSKNNSKIRFIIAPHEIGRSTIEKTKKKFCNAVLFSEWLHSPLQHDSCNVLIIDNIGMLSSLYKFASVTYIGGGFNKSGIHNTLEAAVYGKPVLFGPNYSKFKEAIELVEAGGAFSISGKVELESRLNSLFNDLSKLEKSGNCAKAYVQENTGATAIISAYIRKNVF